jgi:hypothetical protein
VTLGGRLRPGVTARSASVVVYEVHRKPFDRLKRSGSTASIGAYRVLGPNRPCFLPSRHALSLVAQSQSQPSSSAARRSPRVSFSSSRSSWSCGYGMLTLLATFAIAKKVRTSNGQNWGEASRDPPAGIPVADNDVHARTRLRRASAATAHTASGIDASYVELLRPRL